MGHTRLGVLPKSREWKAVVGYLISSDLDEFDVPVDIPELASATLFAVEEGFKKAIEDTGLTDSVLLLIRLILASRSSNPLAELGEIGISLNEESDVFDVISQFQDVLDDSINHQGGRTDVSEIAQQAAGETLREVFKSLESSFFGANLAEIISTLKNTSTKAGFAHLGRNFFSSFMARYLNFYLSRAMASNIDSSRLGQIGALTSFNGALKLHCDQSARIVETFAGDWYSKAIFYGGITQDNTGRFIAVAMKKMAQELKMQREGL